MKKWMFFAAVFAVFCSLANAQSASKETPNSISYSIASYGGWPQRGESAQLSASVTLNDTTGAIEKFSFTAPLMSFIDAYGRSTSFLARLGNYWYYPDISFASTTVEQKDKMYLVRGRLYFRGQNEPVTLTVSTQKDDNSIALDGSFNFFADDFLMFMPIGFNPGPVMMTFHANFELPVHTGGKAS